jgi:hypothetical protein
MLFKKRTSWYWLTVWALVFAGFMFSVSRFFLHAIDKEARVKLRKQGKKSARSPWEELFV